MFSLQVPNYEKLTSMLEKGKELGIEVRGPSDHGSVHSIYFRDPNGYVVELTCSMSDPTAHFTDAKKSAHATLTSFVEKYSPPIKSNL